MPPPDTARTQGLIEGLASLAAYRLGEDPDAVRTVRRLGDAIYFTLATPWPWANDTYRLVPQGDRRFIIERGVPMAAAGCGTPAGPLSHFVPIDRLDGYDTAGGDPAGPARQPSPDTDPAGDLQTELPGGPDATEGCQRTPRTYEGDGTHLLRAGDTIRMDNGLLLAVTEEEIHESGSLLRFSADLFAGAERVNLTPLAIYAGHPCRNTYGLLLAGGDFAAADPCEGIPITVTSALPGPLTSRQTMYQRCVEAGTLDEEICRGYIPWEAAPTEATYATAQFRVFTPADLDPTVGGFLLGQLAACYQTLTDYLGVTEIFPALSLRWFQSTGTAPVHLAHFFIQWEWPPDWGTEVIDDLFSQKLWDINDPACHDRGVVHELAHLIRQGIVYHVALEEGLARLGEWTLAKRSLTAAPYLSAAVAAGDVIALPVSGGTLAVAAIDAAAQTVTLQDPGGISTTLSAASFAYLSEQEFVAVESVFPNHTTLSLYLGAQPPFTNQILCGATQYHEWTSGFYVGDVFYHAADQGAPLPVPYISLAANPFPDDVTSNTAACFWQRLVKGYGVEILRAFLKKGAEVRAENLTGGLHSFCWMKTLATLMGKDPTMDFAPFGLLYDPDDCAGPWHDTGPEPWVPPSACPPQPPPP
ncbi:MAG: hypothetical protein HY543_03340 [Deltaproteobacteria bacterium]|nr:hypothetical protein [Deltaproteobacteria bacterium]